MSETRKSSDTDLTHFRGGLMCKNCGQLSVHHGQYGNCPTPAEHPSPSTPPAQTGEAKLCPVCGSSECLVDKLRKLNATKPVQPWMEAAAKEIKGECCDNQCSNSDIHFVTAIIAKYAPSSPEEWRPIETAPRDGSHFIAANLTPGHIGFGYFEDKAVPFCDVVHYWPNEGEEGFYPSNGPDEPYTFLTHWKPLCTITQ